MESFVEVALQPVAQQKTGVGREPQPEFTDGFLFDPPGGQIVAGMGAFGTPKLFLEKCAGAFVHLNERSALAGLFGLGGGSIYHLCERAYGFFVRLPRPLPQPDV